jgi:hypothetical protein
MRRSSSAPPGVCREGTHSSSQRLECLLKEKNIRRHLNGPRRAVPLRPGSFFSAAVDRPPDAHSLKLPHRLIVLRAPSFQTAGVRIAPGSPGCFALVPPERVPGVSKRTARLTRGRAGQASSWCPRRCGRHRAAAGPRGAGPWGARKMLPRSAAPGGGPAGVRNTPCKRVNCA